MSNNWFQDSPNSYKIQVLYQRIPEFVKKQSVDTPFRFSTYQDADTVGKELFGDVEYRIVGSNDKPHWNSTPPKQQAPAPKLTNKAWYDLTQRAQMKQQAQMKQSAQRTQMKQSAQRTQIPEELTKLKPQNVTPGVVPKKQ
jgi:hypothetical protein